MRLAIFGASCVGKSAAARIVSQETGISLRSCGDAVRAAARTLGIPPEVVPDETHLSVDAETVEWARASRPCLIEGRFLDEVLAAERDAGMVTLVALTASDSVRAARARARSRDESFSFSDLSRLDADDGAFRSRLYGGPATGAPDHVLDTSERTVVECVAWLRQLIAATT